MQEQPVHPRYLGTCCHQIKAHQWVLTLLGFHSKDQGVTRLRKVVYFIALPFTVQNVKNLQEDVKEIMSQPRPLLQDRPKLI